MQELTLSSLSNITGVIALIAWAACLIVDLRRGITRIVTGRTAVFVSVLIWYLLEVVQTPAELNIYTQSEYDLGVFYLSMSMAAFIIAYHWSRYSLFASFARKLLVLAQPRVLWMLVLIGMTVGLGSLLIYSGWDVQEPFRGLIGPRPRWTALGRGRFGNWSSLIYELQVFLMATVPLAIALVFMRQAAILPRIISGIFVAWMFLRVFWSGTRTPMILIVVSISAALFWNVSPRWRVRSAIIGIPFILIGGYFWSATVVSGRNAGAFDTSQATEVNYVGFEMFRELLFILRATNDGMPIQWGMTYYTQLVNPIPRALWPDKPVADAGLLMAQAYGAVDGNGDATMTVSPGFVGEAYLNFGLLGLMLVPAVAGVCVRSWDDMFPIVTRSLPTFIVYAGGIAIILMSGRSFNASAFYPLMCLYFLIVVITSLPNATPTRAPPDVISRASREAPYTKSIR